MPDLKTKLVSWGAEELAEPIADKMAAVAQSKRGSAVWILALSLALFNDFLDWFVIGSLPFIGNFIDITTWLILYMFTSSLNATAPLLGLRIKFLWWIIGLTEQIPILGGIVPTWTIGILWTWYKVHKRQELAEQGLKQIEEGQLSQEVAEEFA